MEDETFDPIPPAPAGPHPAPDEIYRARTDPTWSRGAAILAHAAACAACTEEMLRQEAFDEPGEGDAAATDSAWERFLEAEAEGAPGPASGGGREERPAGPVLLPPSAPRPAARRTAPDRRRPGRALLLLAATFAACFVGLSLWRLRTPGAAAPPVASAPAQAPVIATGGETEVTRGGPSGSTAVWSPSGELPAAPHEFLFPQESAGARRVTVYDATRSYFWTSPPSRTGSIPFPESERSKLTPGVDYFWTLLGDEGVPSEGAALRFRLEPPVEPR